MKSKHILAALEAMREAEVALNDIHNKPISATEGWRLYDGLQKARISLKVFSGLEDVEVEVTQ